ncbi:MAG: SPOR domain-containing protein [Bacteroidaceae bacterium]|jgi:cell division protein FtsN|nr:SPOR domain-containing protein [Bacteroidaceae bacterium]
MKFQIEKLAIVALGVCTAACFSSCKSNESMYKKAYEKAQAQTKTEQTEVKTEEPEPVKIAPVTTTTKKTDTSDEPVKTEKVTVVSGAGLKAFSVVCGSFSLKANAEGLQSSLKKKGYEAQIALNNERKLYRVIASTFDEKSDAVQSRNKLRGTYPDAWLLYNN